MFQFTNTAQHSIVDKFQAQSSFMVWRKGPGFAPAAPAYKLPAIWRK